MSDAKVRTYANTALEFNDNGALRAVDLRRPAGPEEHRLLMDLQLRAPFAVITAANLHGQEGGPENPERFTSPNSSMQLRRVFARCWSVPRFPGEHTDVPFSARTLLSSNAPRDDSAQW